MRETLVENEQVIILTHERLLLFHRSSVFPVSNTF
jgi:hypothetical protein